MNIQLKKYSSDKSIRKKLKKLYLTAFPQEERAPFSLIMSKVKKKKAEMLTAYDNDEFVGFAYMVCQNDLAYLFYFAVDESKRGKGYGSRILQTLKEQYKDRRIFLAREQLDKSADNYNQRVNRHNFYLRSGFEDLPCQIKEASVIYDVMGIGGNISAEEYRSLITSWAGKLLSKIIDMRIIEK